MSVALEINNPNTGEDLQHLPPESLVEDLLAKVERIVETSGGIGSILARP